MFAEITEVLDIVLEYWCNNAKLCRPNTWLS